MPASREPQGCCIGILYIKRMPENKIGHSIQNCESVLDGVPDIKKVIHK